MKKFIFASTVLLFPFFAFAQNQVSAKVIGTDVLKNDKSDSRVVNAFQQNNALQLVQDGQGYVHLDFAGSQASKRDPQKVSLAEFKNELKQEIDYFEKKLNAASIKVQKSCNPLKFSANDSDESILKTYHQLLVLRNMANGQHPQTSLNSFDLQEQGKWVMNEAIQNRSSPFVFCNIAGVEVREE
jgi:hypothetical protein